VAHVARSPEAGRALSAVQSESRGSSWLRRRPTERPGSATCCIRRPASRQACSTIDRCPACSVRVPPAAVVVMHSVSYILILGTERRTNLWFKVSELRTLVAGLYGGQANCVERFLSHPLGLRHRANCAARAHEPPEKQPTLLQATQARQARRTLVHSEVTSAARTTSRALSRFF